MKTAWFALIGALALAPAALAQSNDPLEDILRSEDAREETVADERRALESGDLDDRIGVQSEDIALPEEERQRRRIIKALPRKRFLKIGRWEAAPHVGFVTNDPFINRYLLGASVAHHFTEVFAVELVSSFSPDFGRGDWKPITEQLVEENQVSPDISKILFYGNLNFQFSPIYGKVSVLGRRIVNFDLFGTFGTGLVYTRDDLEALQAEDDPDAIATQAQYHPTTNFGGGFRIILNENLAIRLEGRSMIYVETVKSTTLEMKNNFMLLGSVAFFFAGVE
jgi:outer membrane beta-barrel protein